jgi:hypothetical protein
MAWTPARAATRPASCEALAVDGKAPAPVLVIAVTSVFFQCARAIERSRPWSAEAQATAGTLPTPGAILECLSGAAIDGRAYDAALQARQADTIR